MTEVWAELRRWRPAPADSRHALLATGLIVPLGALLALFRVGDGGYRGVVWAEDGVVFLGSVYTEGGWHALLTPYNGYLHLVPRTIAAVVGVLPIGWHGVAVNVAATAVQAAVACFAFHVVRANTRGLVAPAVVALSVLLVPLGGETVGNLANLQWFLLVAGGIAPFWTPAGRPGRVASVAFVLALTTSCPFGGIALAGSAAAWLLTRSRYTALLTAAAALGTAVEAVGMLRAPSRNSPIEHSFAPFDLAHGYVVRVAGDGVVGLHFGTLRRLSESTWPGLAVLAATAVLAALVVRRHGWPAVLVPGVIVGESLVTFAAPVVLGGVHWRVPVEAPRYYVAPALLLVTAVALLAGRLTRDAVAREPAFGARAIAGGLREGAPFVVAGLLASGLVVGWATSYSTPGAARDGGPAWASQVDRAAARCSRGHAQVSPQGPAARLRIAPPGWVVAVPCARLG